ncbi:septal ring lytic transglycosylase RlpA family protein [Synechococcus sp. MIT S9508]
MSFMERLIKVASILLIFSAIGCGKDAVKDKAGNDQALLQKVHQQPTSQAVQGQASWFGPGHYGNKTASGEILKKGTMTAAHSSLPMGTKVKVTRLDNNKSVTVVINDRKPFKQGTVIDLAHSSATALDVRDDGKTAVEIEVLY